MATYRVDGVGETRAERLVSLVLLGDLMSLYLAVLRGVDPTPVEVIDQLKSALAQAASAPGGGCARPALASSPLRDRPRRRSRGCAQRSAIPRCS